MPEDKKDEAPKLFGVASWTMAAIGAVAFAFTMGFLAFQSAQNPLIASTTETQPVHLDENKCLDGKVAINNYPGGLTEAGSHQAYYDKMGEDFWRCTQITVPDLNENEPCNSPGNAAKVTSYLTNARSGGQELQFVADKANFNAVPDNQKKYAVVTSSLKPACVGPNSKDYESLTDANKDAIKPVQENTTYETWKKEQDEAKAKAAEMAAQPAVGPPGATKGRVPVTSGKEGQVSQGSSEAEPPQGEETRTRLSDSEIMRLLMPAHKTASGSATVPLTSSVFNVITVGPQPNKPIMTALGGLSGKGKIVSNGWVCAVLSNDTGTITAKRKTISGGYYDSMEISAENAKYVSFAAWFDNGIWTDQYNVVKNLVLGNLSLYNQDPVSCTANLNNPKSLTCKYSPRLSDSVQNKTWKGSKEAPIPAHWNPYITSNPGDYKGPEDYSKIWSNCLSASF